MARTVLLMVGVAIVLSCGQVASAQQQAIVLKAGYFAVRGADTRIADDVLLTNLNVFAFDLRDFNHGTIGGEWLLGVGDYFEAGVGLGYYQRTVPSVYLDYINANGFEIEQDLRLKVVPLTGTIRVHPFSRQSSVSPYFGAGLGAFNWRYSEVGEFVDFDTFDVFRDRYVASGTDLGGLVFGGVRVPFGDRFAAGVELRYDWAQGRVGIDRGFLNERIDLGGLSTTVAFHIGF